MEPRSVRNQLSVGGHLTGPVIQSGGNIKVTGGITVRTGDIDHLARLADRVDQVREVLRAHAEKVPRRAVTDLGLGQIVAQARDPKPGTPGVVGELWRELLPELSALAGTIGELSALKPHLSAITESVSAL